MGDSNNITDIKFDNIPLDLKRIRNTNRWSIYKRFRSLGQNVYASEQFIEGNPDPLKEIMFSRCW